MPALPAARSRVARLLRAAGLVAAAAVLPLSVATPASADPLAGRTITGELVQAYPESAGTEAPASAPLTWVQPASGEPVRIDSSDVSDVPSGSTVRLTVGGAVDDDSADGYGTAHGVTGDVVVTDPAGTTAAATTPAAPSTTSSVTAVPVPAGTTDRVTVVLVEAGGGSPDATTVQDLTDAVDGEVRDFWAGQTGGAVALGVSATLGWTATTAGCDRPTQLWNEAATAAGFTDAPGNHLLVYVSGRSTDVHDCSYGLAEVGSGLGSGGRLYVEDPLPSLIAHELGHNLGLGHSSGRQCDGAVDTGSCRTEGYRDYYDVMGASWEHVGTLNAAQEARLGVLPAAQRATLTSGGAGGSVTLAPLSGRTGTRALELTAADGTDYWLEYRSATGQDAWLDTAADRLGLGSGVLLHRSGDLPDTSLLLDGTPSAAAGWNGDLREALPVGSPVPLGGGFTVTVTALTSTGAVVSVTTTPASTSSAAATAAKQPRTMPAQRCSTAGTCAAPDETTGAGQPGVSSILGYPIPVPAAEGHRVTATARPLALTALRTPPGLAAGLALTCGLVLLGWTVARMRGKRRRRAGTRAGR